MSLRDRDYFRPSGFGGFSLFPSVIKTLLIINVVVFFLQMILDNISFGGIPGWYLINKYFALNPIGGFDQAGQPYNFQIWQLITYQFMHGGFFHIFFNMLVLWMFGMEIENLWGSKKFLFFYLTGGVVAGLTQILVAPLFGSVGFTVGASGSIFAVMIAFGMTFPDRYVFLLFPPVPMKAKYLIAFLVLIELFSVGDASLIARLAHIGGAFFGFAFVMLDKSYHFDIDGMFRSVKGIFTSSGESSNSQFKRPKRASKSGNIEDADFYEINNKRDEEKASEEVIDAILDKISKSGYQNLTEKEKRILFEASKKD